MGGRLGGVFDEDPRRWRLTAEAFATIGLALEIATAFDPQLFVVLAGAGNFSKAIGKGLGRPCFRIIQTHFALQNNIGDISAKEEVSSAPAAGDQPVGFRILAAPLSIAACARLRQVVNSAAYKQ